MINKFLPITLLFYGATAFAQSAKNDKLTPYVKPIIGTQRMGHTYPGATVPFGMVQLSPETDTITYDQNGKYNPDVYKYCAGYQYDDKTIVGFSHTHFSGTGHSDLGDILIMPTVGKLQLNPGTASNPAGGYRSTFSHQNEIAEANYYKVKLDKNNITAELTTTTRVGMHQYTFPKSNQAHIILDMVAGIYNYPEKNVWTYLRVLNDSTVIGYRQTNGWARTRSLYFALSFSKPFIAHGFKNFTSGSVYRGFWGKFNQTKNFPETAGKQIKAWFDFNTAEGEKIDLKVALSPVSMENALANMKAEAPGWDFNKIREAGQQQWEEQLHRIVIQSKSRAEKENFYTGMYHAMINPTIYMDVNGDYKGLDQNVHHAEGFTNYTTFSLWDTYRALHPLFNIIETKRNADMVKSMLKHYEQSPEHMLPVWSNSGNENWCMSGYHAVAVLADAAIKGNGDFDKNEALEACVATARHRDYEGIGEYIDRGYIPDERSAVSVSSTLEYAYDDWAIAQLAKKLGRDDIYQEFIKRSQNYKNVYDPKVGFMRPKLADGTFRKNFDPLTTINQGFIEGNAWNYTLFAPQDPKGLIELMGGNKRVVRYLDSLFTMHLPDEFFAETEDITRDGIIGNYVHGNEPSHHVAYLYNWTDKPWKTQERIRMILKKMYGPTPDGLGGNDDTGQMSAWYIFSTLGFYPVAPGSDDYSIGSPAIDKAVINLENGKTFSIIAKNQSDKNIYVQKITLNGKTLNVLTIKHSDIMNGGELVFYMRSSHK
ncbi:GH92 family glycosyl hydrolase [Mucilaginibacter sp. KACC 22063]|uniref:GH92 family glycosyl hydrolase n=1 Tax=Mucilaginibacter sp. KACC 22063 TaxID=3025666 RepID=UPI00236705B8|nr:GH92 family glycosyl hydrolase [Mucilaginibacter sp. KACC 22063]WDF56332.1 GH92 family glycosyl hydrolase [Mucilaginibacter sp. KACC 22063]